jgi:Dockerin type I domain
MSHPEQDDSTEDLLPEAFRSFLNNRYGTVPQVPSSVDEQILRNAREQFAPKTGGSEGHWRSRSWFFAAAGTSVAAAGLLVTGWMTSQFGNHPESSPLVADMSPGGGGGGGEGLIRERPSAMMAAVSDPQDVDLNGRVNILDAFALARSLQNGTAGNGRNDLNQDGRIDDEDVDLIAMRAVAL